MQISRKDESKTNITLTIVAEAEELTKLKNHTLEHFRTKLKLSGFRTGKAPLSVVEKNVDPQTLQTEFLDEAINSLYRRTIESQNIRPTGNPQVSIKKFVPFTVLEFDAAVEVVGPIKLGDYKKIKKTKGKVSVSAKDVERVLEDLAKRAAERKDVKRAAKKGDEVVLDFSGKDQKGQPIKGADGKDYPLVLGSNSFIPGFEDNLIGLNPDESKDFTLTFPKDYGVKALANKKVTFAVTIKKVNEILEAKLDDKFASKVGPFKTLQELKDDIKKQLLVEKQQQANRALENEIIQELVSKSDLELPESLVTEQIERLKNEVRQNLVYRGQTWQEMLDAEGLSEEEFTKKQLRPEAEQRVKTGLLLAEVSIAEKLEINPEELDVRMDALRAQYTDPTMQAELAKPEAKRDIASRMLTEKTVERLVSIATKS